MAQRTALAWLAVERGMYRRIPVENQGQLWSEQLQSYLVMEGYEGRELHLYDNAGQRRLTEEEAERDRANLLESQRDVERNRAQELESQRDAERERAKKLEELLRKLDPNFKEEDLN